jgi:hypothetical protein
VNVDVSAVASKVLLIGSVANVWIVATDVPILAPSHELLIVASDNDRSPLWLLGFRLFTDPGVDGCECLDLKFLHACQQIVGVELDTLLFLCASDVGSELCPRLVILRLRWDATWDVDTWSGLDVKAMIEYVPADAVASS